MSVNALLTQRPEPKRDRFGRYLIGGKPYTRATTWAETVGDRYNLEKWKQRMTATGLVARQDLYAALAATPVDDKKKIDKLCEQALEAAKGTAGANLGTALHAFTERLDMGEELIVPAPWDADVAAYRKTLDEAHAGMDVRYIERIVVNHTLGVAGTFDRLLELPELGLIVGDLKTGGFLEWGAIAIQLALYANAEELYDPLTDTCEPMPFVNRDKAVVIHLPVGQATCTLYQVDITAGWEMAQVVGIVRRWRNRKDLANPLVSVEPEEQKCSRCGHGRQHHNDWWDDDNGHCGMGCNMAGCSCGDVEDPPQPELADVEMRAWLRRRAEQLATVDGGLEALAAAWPVGVPTFRQSENHDAEQLRRIEAAMRTVEQRFDLRVPNFDATSTPDAGVIEAMIGRLKALPDDLLAAVEAAVKGKVPNLKSTAVRAEHLDLLEKWVAEAEAEHALRHRQVREYLAAIVDLDDVDLTAAVWTRADIKDPTRLISADVDAVRALADEIANRQLVFVADLSGQWTLVVPQPVEGPATEPVG